MLQTLAIANYRSLLSIRLPLGPLNLITGANGSGKSNLYRALRLLAAAAQGGVVGALAREGGLESTFWAGPESLSRGMRQGTVPVQGGPRRGPKYLRLGFADEDFGYAIALGLPAPSDSAFALDPEITREDIWAGPSYRPAGGLVQREGPLIKVRAGRQWEPLSLRIAPFDSLFHQVADPEATPEVFAVREAIRGWRFYDHFRIDAEAPARRPQIGTRTPVLDADGHDWAAALQTIREIGDAEGLDRALADAFPGARIGIQPAAGGRFQVEFYQEGLLRPLAAAELSDGTLRYLLWLAALLTPRPPPLMVLNEPETSLHPELLPALARLIARVAARTQVWVVSHSVPLIQALEAQPNGRRVELEKALGQTLVKGQGLLDQPPWYWPGA